MAREETQAFFVWMLERGFLERADPARGRFRGFIKKSLANFLHDRERGRRTVKRGGTHEVLALPEGDEAGALPDPAGRPPEAVLDELWRRELLAHAADALERELREQGKARVFAVFHDYFLGEEDLDYAAVARFYDEGATEGFRERRTEARDRAFFERIRNDLGDLTIEGLRRTGPATAVATLQAEKIDLPVVFAFNLVDGRIDGISVSVGGPPGGRPGVLELPEAGTDDQLRAALDGQLEKLAAEDRFSGVVLLALDGERRRFLQV